MLFEILLALAVGGGLLVYFQRTARSRASPETIMSGGSFTCGAPGRPGVVRPFHDMTLYPSGFMLRDIAGNTLLTVQLADIQWVSAVRLTDGMAGLTLHLEVARRWQLVTLEMAQPDMALLARMLRRRLPPERHQPDGQPVELVGPVTARLVQETLHGDVMPDAEVSLYLVPPLLVVLRDDLIVARLDTRSIRRILAVERSSGRMEALLKRSSPDGLIRLYSLYETAVFALPQYRELAEEIAFVAGCSVEYISRDEKARK